MTLLKLCHLDNRSQAINKYIKLKFTVMAAVIKPLVTSSNYDPEYFAANAILEAKSNLFSALNACKYCCLVEGISLRGFM